MHIVSPSLTRIWRQPCSWPVRPNRTWLCSSHHGPAGFSHIVSRGRWADHRSTASVGGWRWAWQYSTWLWCCCTFPGGQETNESMDLHSSCLELPVVRPGLSSNYKARWYPILFVISQATWQPCWQLRSRQGGVLVPTVPWFHLMRNLCWRCEQVGAALVVAWLLNILMNQAHSLSFWNFKLGYKNLQHICLLFNLL